jgi:hypothetical protein
LDLKLLHLVATVIDACDHQPSRGPGRPPTETIRVVATLRRFLREGTPWRSLVATADQASGSTLRRCLACWAETGLLAKVHALLVGMLRGHPDLILDTCSVRAKDGALASPIPSFFLRWPRRRERGFRRGFGSIGAGASRWARRVNGAGI